MVILLLNEFKNGIIVVNFDYKHLRKKQVYKMLQNIEKIKKFIFDEVATLNSHYTKQIQIAGKNLTLVILSKIDKPALQFRHYLVVVDTNEFTKEDWVAGDGTMYRFGNLFYFFDDLKVYFQSIRENNPSLIAEHIKWKESYDRPDWYCPITGLYKPLGTYEKLSNMLNKFNIDIEQDDVKVSIINEITTAYHELHSKYVYHTKTINEWEVTMKFKDDNKHTVEDAFRVTLELVSIDDKNNNSEVFPGETTELLVAVLPWVGEYWSNEVDYTTVLKPGTKKFINLSDLRKEDLDLNSLDKFLKDNYSKYTSIYGNPEFDYNLAEEDEDYEDEVDEWLEYENNYYKKISDTTNAMLDDTFVKIKNQPEKYLKDKLI